MSPVHVMPVNDLREHTCSTACWCNPKIENTWNDGVVVIHNSLDGRELTEPGATVAPN